MKPRAHAGRPSTLPPEWRLLAEAYGGAAGLAAKLGVEPSTVSKWGRGKNLPRGSARVLIEALAKRAGVPCPLGVLL